jgi:Raf kinase inhibitor-like YbhB/YbcL family protein
MLQNLPSGLGRALAGMRPGINALLFAGVNVPALIEISSPAFEQGGPMPALHTADGPGLSPPLSWQGVPAGTASLVLVVEDADSPTPRPLVHAIVTRLPPGDGMLTAGDMPGPGRPGLPGLGMGRNSYFQTGWLPPDPPPGHGPHHYAFQLFALGAWPGGLSGVPGRSTVRAALRHGVLAKGCLIGTYGR